MDDELYTSQERKARKIDKAETSAVLDFEEFVEIIVRVCNEKVCGAPMRSRLPRMHAPTHPHAQTHRRSHPHATAAHAACTLALRRVRTHAGTAGAVSISSPQLECEKQQQIVKRELQREQQQREQREREMAEAAKDAAAPAATATSAAPASSASQVPEPRDASFEHSLATWLGLMFVPIALKNARKRAIKEGAGADRRNVL